MAEQHPTGAAAPHGQQQGQQAHAEAKKSKADEQWQKQANHFKAINDEMMTVLKDKDATEEERTEASQTMDDMNKNLQRLQLKHGVVPA